MPDTPYHLAERGVSVGVWSETEVEAGLATGRLSAATLSWREGEPGWIALTARPEFASAIGAFRALGRSSPALPFDSARSSSAAAAWFATVRAVWTAPRLSFQPSAGKIAWMRSLGFALACAALVAPLLYAQSWILDQAFGTALSGLGRAAPPPRPGVDLSRFTGFLLAGPLLATALLGAGATLAHLLLRLLGGGRGGLAATVRTVAYVGGAISLSAALPAFSCLSPYLLFGYLWVALAAAHGDPIWRPMAALAATALLAACAAGVFLAFALSPFFRPLG